jgi:hypothetical protein
MQKKKFNKAPKVSKFDTNELSNMVFDSIFDMEHTTTKETVTGVSHLAKLHIG